MDSVNLVLVSEESNGIDLRWQQCVSIIHAIYLSAMQEGGAGEGEEEGGFRPGLQSF